jgi:hypothetical protein
LQTLANQLAQDFILAVQQYQSNGQQAAATATSATSTNGIAA